jgi:hypothetical protein
MYGQQDIIGYADIIGAGDLAYPSVATFANPTRRMGGIASMLSNPAAAQQLNIASMLSNPAAAQQLNLDALVGAVVNKLSAMRRPMQPPGTPEGVSVANGPEWAMRETWLGLGDPQTLPANATQTIVVQPQLVCRIARLIITPLDAGSTPNDFTVSQIEIGNLRQINGQAALPGAMFQADGFNLNVKTNTVNIGNTVAITLTNRTANPRTFAFGAVALQIQP